MGCWSVSNLLLFATLVSIVAFLFESISFALDQWLIIGLTIPANSSQYEPSDENVKITGNFGLWEIYVTWSNGTATNSTSAKMFHSPDTWTEGGEYVAELKPNLLVDIHKNLLASEILVSIGMGMCFFVAIGLTLHKFAPQLEKNSFFLFGSATAMLAAGIICIIGGVFYLETTQNYCKELKDEYKKEESLAPNPKVVKTVDYCTTSFVNALAIIGGVIELVGWTLMVGAIVFRRIEQRTWSRFH